MPGQVLAGLPSAEQRLQLTKPSPVHHGGDGLCSSASGSQVNFWEPQVDWGLQMSGNHRAPKAEIPGGEGDVTLLYAKCRHGNNKVGNVLELVSEMSFLWVSLNFWQKFTADFIPDLFPHSL